MPQHLISDVCPTQYDFRTEELVAGKNPSDQERTSHLSKTALM